MPSSQGEGGPLPRPARRPCITDTLIVMLIMPQEPQSVTSNRKCFAQMVVFFTECLENETRASNDKEPKMTLSKLFNFASQ